MVLPGARQFGVLAGCIADDGVKAVNLRTIIKIGRHDARCSSIKRAHQQTRAASIPACACTVAGRPRSAFGFEQSARPTMKAAMSLSDRRWQAVARPAEHESELRAVPHVVRRWAVNKDSKPTSGPLTPNIWRPIEQITQRTYAIGTHFFADVTYAPGGHPSRAGSEDRRFTPTIPV